MPAPGIPMVRKSTMNGLQEPNITTKKLLTHIVLTYNYLYAFAPSAISWITAISVDGAPIPVEHTVILMPL